MLMLKSSLVRDTSKEVCTPSLHVAVAVLGEIWKCGPALTTILHVHRSSFQHLGTILVNISYYSKMYVGSYCQDPLALLTRGPQLSFTLCCILQKL